MPGGMPKATRNAGRRTLLQAFAVVAGMMGYLELNALRIAEEGAKVKQSAKAAL